MNAFLRDVKRIRPDGFKLILMDCRPNSPNKKKLNFFELKKL